MGLRCCSLPPTWLSLPLIDAISKKYFKCLQVPYCKYSITTTVLQLHYYIFFVLQIVCIYVGTCVRKHIRYGRSQNAYFIFYAYISYNFCDSDILYMLLENRSRIVPTILRFLRRTVIPLSIVCNSSKEAGGTRVVMVPI